MGSLHRAGMVQVYNCFQGDGRTRPVRPKPRLSTSTYKAYHKLQYCTYQGELPVCDFLILCLSREISNGDSLPQTTIPFRVLISKLSLMNMSECSKTDCLGKKRSSALPNVGDKILRPRPMESPFRRTSKRDDLLRNVVVH
jgi:hypothetical protein